MMEFAQIYDRVETVALSNSQIDSSGLVGTWINSNKDTNSIARVNVSESEERLSLQVFAMGPDGLIDWGTIDAEVFASGPSSSVGAGFTAHYDFGFAEARLQGMIMKGLLVLAQFHVFKDESKRANYFLREYFGLTHGRF